jgi:hypothetical protein
VRMDKISGSFFEFAYSKDSNTDKSLLELLKVNATLSSDLVQCRSSNSALSSELTATKAALAQSKAELAQLKVVLEKKQKSQQQQDTRVVQLEAELQKVSSELQKVKQHTSTYIPLPPHSPPPPPPPPPPPAPPSLSTPQGQYLTPRSEKLLEQWMSDQSSLDFSDWKDVPDSAKLLVACPPGFVRDIGEGDVSICFVFG